MQKKQYRILGLILMGALILPATDAFARKGKSDRGHRGGMMKELNLTPEQKQKIKELRSNNKEKFKAAREEMQAARKELQAAMKSDASEQEIWAKFENLKKVQEKFSRDRFEKVMAVRKVLTPEQRSKFRGMMGKGFGKKGHHGKKGRRAQMDDDDDGEEE